MRPEFPEEISKQTSKTSRLCDLQTSNTSG